MPKIVDDEQIFQATLKIISERGYAGAATKQIARAAGVSEVTLFRKFENKARLVKQAIAFVTAQTSFASSAGYTGDVHADLLRVVQAYQDTSARHGQFFFALFADLARHPELIDSLEDAVKIFQSIGAVIIRYQAEGVLTAEHPLHAVATLLAPLMYISTIRNAKLDRLMPALDLSKHVASYLEGRLIEK